MVGNMIQTSRRSILSLITKTLTLPKIHQPFQTNRIMSIFQQTNSFSASALQSNNSKKSPFESNLVRMLTNEIEFESDYAPPHQPDKIFKSFMVEDRPGEQFVTLRGRSTVDENIKIEATMFDGYAIESRNSRDEDTEPNTQLHISLLVDISKGEGGDMLEFVCSAWPERLEIQKLYVIGPHGTFTRPYMGPDFRVLNKRLQKALNDFLNARGVNDDLCIFLHRYVWNKDKKEHIQRLKLLKSYVEG